MRFVGIDTSTKTGFVALDENGSLLEAKEITGESNKDPERMVTLIDNIMNEIKPNDIIVIENFGFSSRQGIMLGGIGWGLRMQLYREWIEYTDVAPAQLKKFATNKGNASKESMILPIYKNWTFEHDSDNVRDAYVLAQMARGLHGHGKLYEYQKEVLKKIGQ